MQIFGLILNYVDKGYMEVCIMYIQAAKAVKFGAELLDSNQP